MHLRSALAVLLVSALPALVSADPENPDPSGGHQIVAVWPDGRMPGTAATAPEAHHPSPHDPYIRITNISHPTLTLFPVPNRTDPAPAVIVCPGGGYTYVVYDKEGTEIANWLNSHNIAALVLKYRTPSNREGALQDVERSISLTRAHAQEWHLDPNRIGGIGFSAGGNAVARASNLFAHRAYAPIDAIDQVSCRPDFAMLVYPAYLERDGKLATDLDLTAKIPPTLIIQTEDDRNFVKGGKMYHAALDAAHIPNEYHLYSTGGHGYALHATGTVQVWPGVAVDWLRGVGVR